MNGKIYSGQYKTETGNIEDGECKAVRDTNNACRDQNE